MHVFLDPMPLQNLTAIPHGTDKAPVMENSVVDTSAVNAASVYAPAIKTSAISLGDSDSDRGAEGDRGAAAAAINKLRVMLGS
jgi:hypothetical protein